MLICDNCEARSTEEPQGVGWFQVGQQLMDSLGRLAPQLVARRDFCSPGCIEQFYVRQADRRAATNDHPTERLYEMGRAR